MTLTELVGELRRLDVRLRVEGGNLRFDAPPGVMTESLRETLKQRKSELVATLQAGLEADPRAIPRRTRTGAAPRVMIIWG